MQISWLKGRLIGQHPKNWTQPLPDSKIALETLLAQHLPVSACHLRGQLDKHPKMI